MTPTDVREKILDDHARLRGKAEVLRSLATQVLRGDADLTEAMQLKAQDLELSLIRHMQWEERYFLPFLRANGAGAADTADLIFEEHLEQRAKLSDSLIQLQGATGERGTQLAGHILDLLRWLESDMTAEEARIAELVGAAPVDDPATGPGPRA